MENIVYEAGYLITYALCELDTQKEVNPIYFHIDLEYNRKTKEIRGNSLSDTIPKAIKKLQKNAKKTICNMIIFPAELENQSNKRETALVSMIFDNINEKSLTIIVPYSLNGHIITREYEVIDSDNIHRDEFLYLESIFNKGLLNFEQGRYIWNRSFNSNKSNYNSNKPI
jgi:hypothetical protein